MRNVLNDYMAMQDGVLHIEGIPGQHIRDAITEAKDTLRSPSLASTSYAVLKFNGCELTIHRRTNPASKYAEWQRSQAAARRRFIKSAEGRRAEKDRWQRLQSAQAEVDACIGMLRKAATTRDVVLWLKRFTHPADHVGVVWNRKLVLYQLRAMNFKSNAGVGTDPTKWDDEDCAAWIIGQAINCMDRMGAPHPMAVTFCEQWLDGSWREKAQKDQKNGGAS